MSSTLSKIVSNNRPQRLSGWEMAICDAENEILKAKARIDALTLSIGNFKEFQESGEPFPGEKKARRSKRAKQTDERTSTQ